VVQLGAADAALPISQTLKAQGTVAGTTNVAGANLTIQSGPGTGSGAESSIVFQTPTVGSTGTVQQTQATRATIGPNGVIAAGSVLTIRPTDNVDAVLGFEDYVSTDGTRRRYGTLTGNSSTGTLDLNSQFTVNSALSKVSIQTNGVTRLSVKDLHYNFSSLAPYATNTDALAGGLVAGDLYYTDVAGEHVVKLAH
jgi:hypothetical protein